MERWSSRHDPMKTGARDRYALRFLALAYLAVILAAPRWVFWNAFDDRFGAAWRRDHRPGRRARAQADAPITAIAVPLDTVFEVAAALILVRRRVPEAADQRLIDLPLALSPVVVGLALILVWGNEEASSGPAADDLGVRVIFALPGMVLATIFICLPFVVREVVPVLREVGTEQEEAAATLRVRGLQRPGASPSPRSSGALIYGVVLTTARALGEYGAVRVVSGSIAEKTQTMTLHVEEQYQSFDYVSAYSASVVLALLALATVLVMNLLNRKDGVRGDHGH